MLNNLSINDERYLFENDLAEYKASEQGKLLKMALDDNNAELVAKYSDMYYTDRNNNRLVYANENDRLKGKELDNYIS